MLVSIGLQGFIRKNYWSDIPYVVYGTLWMYVAVIDPVAFVCAMNMTVEENIIVRKECSCL